MPSGEERHRHFSHAQRILKLTLSLGTQLCIWVRTAHWGKFVIHTEPLAESTLVLSTSAQKRALLLRSAAVAADMESAALAALAQTAHVPFVAIRAVSDTADARVPQWLSDVINDTGRVSLRYAIKGLLLHPRDWIVVSRLAFGFRAARATLTDVARQAGESLVAAAS